MRNNTEPPEGIKSGVVKLVGTDTGNIVSNVQLLLQNPEEYNKMATDKIRMEMAMQSQKFRFAY